ncbi:MAG TPA: hypothetical protein VFN28_06790, partial [Amaricoccus sp.]|nr:hypothetical protein [Amaricoccus sp.]
VIPAAAFVPAPPSPAEGRALLVLHNAFAGTWKAVGAARPENAGWLREIASAPPLASDLGGDAEHVVVAGPALDLRLALSAPRFEDADPIVAEIAGDQVARAPYGALSGVAGRLDPAILRAFLDAPGTGPRRPSYILLLGLAGDDRDAAAIEARLALARQRRDATDLAALLAADMELRGPARVGWVEATYLADRDRSLPEVEAALAALSVQGEADATVPRQAVVAAFRRFIRARPAMAGFVAPDLAHWQAWEASGDYAALLEAGAVSDPAEEFAILTYLQQSPDPAAKAAVTE